MTGLKHFEIVFFSRKLTASKIMGMWDCRENLRHRWGLQEPVQENCLEVPSTLICGSDIPAFPVMGL